MDFEPAAIQSTFDKIIKLNPALRSTFSNEKNTWAQKINVDAGEYFDHESIDADISNSLSLCNNMIAEIEHEPCELEDHSLFHVYLKSFNDKRLLILKISHLLIDGYALFILMKKFMVTFGAVSDAKSECPEISPNAERSYLAELNKQNNLLNSDDGVWRMNWHREMLGDHPLIWTDISNRQVDWVKSVEVLFGKEAVSVLKAACRRRRTSMAVVCYIAFLKALQVHTASTDVLSCFQISNRRGANATLVANLADELPVRYRQRPDCSLEEVVKTTNRALKEARRNWLPYWAIVKELAPQRYYAPMGLTPYLFHFWEQDFSDVQEVGVYPYKSSSKNCNFDVVCNVVKLSTSNVDTRREDGVISLNIKYNSGELSDADANAIAAFIKTQLAEFSVLGGV